MQFAIDFNEIILFGVSIKFAYISILLVLFIIYLKLYSKKDKSTDESQITLKSTADTKRTLIDIVLGLLCLGTFWLITSLIITPFSTIIGLIIRNGFVNIFLGNFSLKYFFSAIILTLVMFFYISLFVFLFLLVQTKKDLRGGVLNSLKKAGDIVFDKFRNVFLLILALTTSLVLMYSGTIFLANAFPADSLYITGATSSSGSKLQCDRGSYLNLIDGYDQICHIFLSQNYSNQSIKYIQMSYYINRTAFTENITNYNNTIFLTFEKKKQPSFVRLYLNKDSEMFDINNQGVFTKEEYYAREKEKAVWFFTIVSFSIFSVFSAVSNIKHILEKK